LINSSHTLEKLKLQVPWKNLYTHPTKVTVDGLYLLVIPKIGLSFFLFNSVDLIRSKIIIEIEYNAKQEEDEQHQAKMKELDQIEKLRNDKDDLGKFVYRINGH